MTPARQFPIRTEIPGARGPVGWVSWDEAGPRVAVPGGTVPATAHIALPGVPDEPSVEIELTTVADGRLTATEVTLRAKPGAPEVRPTHLTGVRTNLNDWLQFAFRAALQWDRTHGGSNEEAWKATGAVFGEIRASSYRRTTDEKLAEVARVYKENFDRYPREAVAAWFQVSTGQAAKLIRQARDAGHLSRDVKRGQKKI